MEAMSLFACFRLYTWPGAVVICRRMTSGRVRGDSTGCCVLPSIKVSFTSPTNASAHSKLTTPSRMSKSVTWPKMPRSWYHLSKVLMACLKVTKFKVLPYKSLKVSSTTELGSTFAPVATIPRISSLGVTLMMSLTPSRVSTASGTQALKKPVLNTRATSCLTSDRVYAKLGCVLKAFSATSLSSPSTPRISTSDIRMRSCGASFWASACFCRKAGLPTSWGTGWED
mmetsp:Transcript_21085/g.58557  ORF Transcript_21085/g.58557 Transcript_21085/m.58557 type:complete len:227 (+) Transcript_21085:1450-2130(+)